MCAPSRWRVVLCPASVSPMDVLMPVVLSVCVCVCSQRELALTDDAFQAAFGMTKDAFAVQPLWRRQNQKGKVGLH